MCNAVMLTIGFAVIGLNYAVLVGVLSGLLSIIPYLGTIITIIPAVILAAVQFQDLLHPILVVVVYSVANTLEGFIISPKIMGDRVGLHPLTIIVALLVGTTLLGGILGGILAIPLTAALRVLMFRYVWRRRAAVAV
jgi:predicted PurR-regulated permease PerM